MTNGNPSEQSTMNENRAGRLAGKVAPFLASDESSFVTGTSVLVDGGLTAR